MSPFRFLLLLSSLSLYILTSIENEVQDHQWQRDSDWIDVFVSSVLGVGDPVLGVGVTVLGVGGTVLGVGGTVLGVGDPVLGVGGTVLGVGGTVLGVGDPVLGVGDPVDEVKNPAPVYHIHSPEDFSRTAGTEPKVMEVLGVRCFSGFQLGDF